MASAPVRSLRTDLSSRSRSSTKCAPRRANGACWTRLAGWPSSSTPCALPTTASTHSHSPSDKPLETERMVTMIDEIYDRHYREAQSELNASIARGLGRFGHAIHDAFEVLVGIEY